jgi:hypothetical protein
VIIEGVHSVHVIIQPIELSLYLWDHVLVNHDWAACARSTRVVGRVLHLRLNRREEARVCQLVAEVSELNGLRIFLLLKHHGHLHLPSLDSFTIALGLTLNVEYWLLLMFGSHEPALAASELTVEDLLDDVLGVVSAIIILGELAYVL